MINSELQWQNNRQLPINTDNLTDTDTDYQTYNHTDTDIKL